MNFYDRENDKWYDDKLKENFIQISKGKYIKPMDFHIETYFETVTNLTFLQGSIEIKIGGGKALKIIINSRITGTLFIDANFKIFSYNSFGKNIQIKFGKTDGKKQYDGAHVFTIDVSKIKCYNYIQISIDSALNNLTLNNLTIEFELNNLTIEFEERFQSLDGKSFKASVSKYIY